MALQPVPFAELVSTEKDLKIEFGIGRIIQMKGKIAPVEPQKLGGIWQ